MSNLFVELQLFPDADAASLATSALNIQQPALRVSGVIATRGLPVSSRSSQKPDRLVLNLEGDTLNRTIVLASLMRAWAGVERVEMAEIVDLEGAGSIGLLGGDEPKLPAP